MLYLDSENIKNTSSHNSLYKHKNANISDPDCERPSAHVNTYSLIIFKDFSKEKLNTVSHKRNYSVSSSISSHRDLISNLKKPKLGQAYDDIIIQDEMYHHPSVKKPTWTWNNLYINAEISSRKPKIPSIRAVEKITENNESYSDRSGYSTPTNESNVSEFMFHSMIKNDPLQKINSNRLSDISDYASTEDNDMFSDNSGSSHSVNTDAYSGTYPQSFREFSNQSPYLITLKDLATKTRRE